MTDSVCELFGEIIRNIFGCICYFVVECDGVVKCGWRCSVGYTMYGLHSMRLDVPSICFVLYVGSYLLI